MLIRVETQGDEDAIARVNCAAFGGDQEARLVEQLRTDGLVIVSLVAVDDSGQIVGHILFSPVTIVTGTNERQIASLAPMAVVPSYQRRGIGVRLVEHGLQMCKHAGYRAVIVVGHPDYYPRFGFSSAFVARLDNPLGAGEAFMGLELARGSLSDLEAGRIVYPRAFEGS
jgi:putative acetyltransferase